MAEYSTAGFISHYKMIPETRKDLLQWMKDHCYNLDSYSIDGNFIYEGFGIDQNDYHFVWYYTERGAKESLNLFNTEKEIVEFAFEKIKSDDWAKNHCIALLKKDTEILKMTIELNRRGVQYWTDKIPYGGPNDYWERIFVIGCDVLKVNDLKQDL